MNISALLTSSGINTAVCAVLFSLYSILRKQPSLVSVYFGQKLAQVRSKRNDPFWLQRFIPSASWIVKSWVASEEELFATGGLDAVVFLRAVVFSIRVFSIAGVICLFIVLPLNYFGKRMEHKHIRDEQLSVFTIENVKEGSRWELRCASEQDQGCNPGSKTIQSIRSENRLALIGECAFIDWLWAHCVALYVISSCACILLYFEYKSITKMRLAYITESHSHPSHFTMLVRAIPWSREESNSVKVAKFFTDYYSSSYLSHQMIYHSGAVQKLMTDAEKIYNMLKSNTMDQHYGSQLLRCGFCGGTSNSFKVLSPEPENGGNTSCLDSPEIRKKECGAALVFFRTRYAALVASEALQQPNPMSWVTDLAPEPSDIYWSNLYVPYRIFWIRKIAILVAFILFVTFFIIPVVFTQSLVHLDKLEKVFPFMKGITERRFMKQLITGYLPSVILMIFLSIVPPIMMVFSTLEGSISRSGRKRSTCIKVLYFVIWNVFFANILTAAAIDHYQDSIMKLGDPKTIPNQLAKAVQSTATFFVTYVLTSGWASLSCELIQPFPLLYNSFYRFILRNKDDSSYGSYTFPYHTEVPRVLLFGLLGFTCSVLAPLILPFLLVYFFLAYLVYRNQILDVYVTKYQTGGLYWPIIHNTTIFSLVLTQIIALGVFGIKRSPIASSFTIPLIICTLLFNEYCRQRFHPVFKKTPAKTIIDMDREDEHSGRMEEIYLKLPSAYYQIKSESRSLGKSMELNCPEIQANSRETGDISRLEDLETPGNMSARLP